jgi:catechol 2,3-dioxygenase-like lactoylglutathione lyase family enzyme
MLRAIPADARLCVLNAGIDVRARRRSGSTARQARRSVPYQFVTAPEERSRLARFACLCYSSGMQPSPFQQFVTFIYVRDLHVSSAFYGDLLGLALALDQGTCRIYRVAGDAYLGICLRNDTAASPMLGSLILTLVVQDVDGWHHYLANRGVTVEQPPQYNPRFNIYHCFLRDPDGYLVEIQRFLDPTWTHGQ